MIFEELRRAYPPGCMVRETPWNGAALLYGLTALCAPRLVVEVGACNGVTASYIAQALKELGYGRYLGFESEPQLAAAARKQLDDVWPGGNHRIEGDFYVKYNGEPVSLAFIDHEPKSAYLTAYERLRFQPGGVLVAHDLTYSEGRAHVLTLQSKMQADGWQTLGFPQERGFLVGIKP